MKKMVNRLETLDAWAMCCVAVAAAVVCYIL